MEAIGRRSLQTVAHQAVITAGQQPTLIALLVHTHRNVLLFSDQLSVGGRVTCVACTVVRRD
ncbi:hypothetical protein B1F67_24975, partial [Pseudomonas syringae]